MSTIRRHGVPFHLLPTAGDSLWLEVIRESDGLVIACEEFTGESEEALPDAVDEWFADIATARVEEIVVFQCGSCGGRRDLINWGPTGYPYRAELLRYEYQLCIPCADRLGRQWPFLQKLAENRLRYEEEEWNPED